MEKNRWTIPNPDGTYRAPCMPEMGKARVEYFMGYYTAFGKMVDIIGKIEDIMPLEEAYNRIKK